MWAVRPASREAPHRTYPACFGHMDTARAVTWRPQERLDPPVVGGTAASASEVEGKPGSSRVVQLFTQSGGRTPCGTRCPGASPCPGGLRAQPWMTRCLHLTRGRGWHWVNPQWGFFLKNHPKWLWLHYFLWKTYNNPKNFVRLKGGDWTWSPAQTQVSPALSPTGQAHHPPSVAWLSSARTPRLVERQVWPQAEGPSVGSKPLGIPLGSLVDHSPHCYWAALSQGMSCFFAFCCDWAPQLSRGDWEVCCCYMLPP